MMHPNTKTNLWQDRFRMPFTPFSYLAKANPNRGLVISNRDDGSFQLYAWDIPAGAIKQLTNLPKGTIGGQISADGQFVYYLDDQTGHEQGHIVRIPFSGGESVDLTPDAAPYVLRGMETSHTGNIFAFNPINQDGFQLWVIDMSAAGEMGTPRQLYQSKAPAWGAKLSHNGELVSMISTERAAETRRYSTLVFDTSSGEKVGELWDERGSIEVVAFSPVPDDMRLLVTTSASGFCRPLIWNPIDNTQTQFEVQDLNGDVVPIDWSPDGKRVLLNQFSHAAQTLYLYDTEQHRLTKLNHPKGAYGVMGGVMGGVACFASEDEIFTHWQDATHPMSIISLDAYSGEKMRELVTVENVPPSHPWESITYTSSDGQEIQGWLSEPAGVGPFPTIINMHGGPHAVETEAFKPLAQSWVDHGFAYLNINFRGSTTFGRDFQEKIWGNIGHWELEDMVAAREWLIDQGIALPDAIMLTGGSYGGYLTLLGLAKRPELWAGGIASAAISDWTVNYEDASEAMKGAFRGWFKGSPDDIPEQYAISSPMTYAEQID
ncbi:MAG: S9 family peptidase, partial [Chloroflexi bacterium]|nr:S9 family peptidase [Chloroflexota bacterium]